MFGDRVLWRCVMGMTVRVRVSPALALAFVALFVSLAGAAVAVTPSGGSSAEMASLTKQVGHLRRLLAGVSLIAKTKTLRISGLNVQIVNGAGKTATANG